MAASALYLMWGRCKFDGLPTLHTAAWCRMLSEGDLHNSEAVSHRLASAAQADFVAALPGRLNFFSGSENTSVRSTKPAVLRCSLQSWLCTWRLFFLRRNVFSILSTGQLTALQECEAFSLCKAPKAAASSARYLTDKRLLSSASRYVGSTSPLDSIGVWLP